ncbi:MAG: hypothetical protein Q9209_005172 [Squamulea sp. 1 TL-2023]
MSESTVGGTAANIWRNRGELAEGWYDPETLRKAHISAADDIMLSKPRSVPTKSVSENGNDDEDDDGYGPALPSNSDNYIERARNLKPSGPTIPKIQDLEFQRGRSLLECIIGATLTVITTELNTEESFRDRETLHFARKSDRRLQREQLEELAPRAAAGTKDRQLERKADLRHANNAFAASKADTSLDVPEADLMGDDDAGLAGYKKRKGEEERKRNEREIRRDEILRARRAEREERIQAYKEKEERTMEGLVALAKARFG